MTSCQKNVKIDVEQFTLPNGLRVVLQADHSDPVVAVAIQYHVGSARERQGKTGFAHFFEHMLFQRSENLPRNAFFNKISELGGEFNGSTDSDGTRYHEIVPRDALEKVLWMESDRMGYFINTVTQAGLEREVDVVANEKRQNYDTRPYGQMIPILSRYAYPEGHPYHHTTIGEIADLRSATVDDVKRFYKDYYMPNNATLVISGDFDGGQARALVEKYFGGIPSGEPVVHRQPMPSPLAGQVRVMHPDPYASMPMLMVSFPAPEKYHPDSYAVQMLGQVLGEGKNSPLYKALVDGRRISPEVETWYYDRELSGDLLLVIPAFEGVKLEEVYAGIGEAFEMYERDGVSQEVLEGYKSVTEVGFYNQMSGVLRRALALAQQDVFGGDPLRGFSEMEEYKKVSPADVRAAYDKYIKGQNSLNISFVPAAHPELALEGSTPAEVTVEDISELTQNTEGEIVDDDYPRTASPFDRSEEPALLSNTPALNPPAVWRNEGAQGGLGVLGVTNDELPVIRFSVLLRGGALYDGAKPGLSSLYAQTLLAGSASRTPEELEQAFKRLGADVHCEAGPEDMEIYGSCLSRNLKQAMELLSEVLAAPRFDENEFEKARQSTLADIMMRADDAGSVAATVMRKVLYGNGVFSNSVSGTPESVGGIGVEDLRVYHATCVSPAVATLLLAGDVSRGAAEAAAEPLRKVWESFAVAAPQCDTAPVESAPGRIYFVDMPGSQQSVIMASCPAMPRADGDFYPAVIANFHLGDGSHSVLFDELRLKRGYTYGAYSSFSCGNLLNRFTMSSKVQGNKTRESVEVAREVLGGYAGAFSGAEMELTRSSMLKAGYGAYETPGALVGMLTEMSLYGLPEDFVRQREEALRTITADRIKQVAAKYIDPSKMAWVVVGDAATQMQRLAGLGFGDPVLLDKNGNPI